MVLNNQNHEEKNAQNSRFEMKILGTYLSAFSYNPKFKNSHT